LWLPVAVLAAEQTTERVAVVEQGDIELEMLIH
jgi:hypothetical protein